MFLTHFQIFLIVVGSMFLGAIALAILCAMRYSSDLDLREPKELPIFLRDQAS